ncbi:conserved oligomeric Golgi complex subunit 4-like [Schistocerca gregaria]|uniref:conserved oligomeric Golgi complex subunit 4-like n=1 Tax=Schistocerca gregaria TaxID=7010 RepID=UPI00211DABFB|nr:conserved oligomeric Golgi complex subunit 4-like [Schistocerca gregaria]
MKEKGVEMVKSEVNEPAPLVSSGISDYAEVLTYVREKDFEAALDFFKRREEFQKYVDLNRKMSSADSCERRVADIVQKFFFESVKLGRIQQAAVFAVLYSECQFCATVEAVEFLKAHVESHVDRVGQSLLKKLREGHLRFDRGFDRIDVEPYLVQLFRVAYEISAIYAYVDQCFEVKTTLLLLCHIQPSIEAAAVSMIRHFTKFYDGKLGSLQDSPTALPTTEERRALADSGDGFPAKGHTELLDQAASIIRVVECYKSYLRHQCETGIQFMREQGYTFFDPKSFDSGLSTTEAKKKSKNIRNYISEPSELFSEVAELSRQYQKLEVDFALSVVADAILELKKMVSGGQESIELPSTSSDQKSQKSVCDMFDLDRLFITFEYSMERALTTQNSEVACHVLKSESENVSRLRNSLLRRFRQAVVGFAPSLSDHVEFELGRFKRSRNWSFLAPSIQSIKNHLLKNVGAVYSSPSSQLADLDEQRRVLGCILNLFPTCGACFEKLYQKLDAKVGYYYAQDEAAQRVLRSSLKEFHEAGDSFKEAADESVQFFVRYLNEGTRTYVDLYATTNYELDSAAFEEGQINDETWVTFYQDYLRKSALPFKEYLDASCFDDLMLRIVSFLAAQVELVTLQKKFSQLGGFQFDSDVRAIWRFFSDCMTGGVRDKLSKLKEIATCLCLEKETDILELWEEAVPCAELGLSDASDRERRNAWHLGPDEVRSFMKRRCDWSPKTIDDLKLR